MKNGKIRRFRPRSNKHFLNRRSNGHNKTNGIQQINGHRNNFLRNNTSRNPHNLEKIIDKYKNLAKEALSSGDKILHENYLQHSDHFSRILSEVVSEKSKNNLSQDTQNPQDNKTNISSD